LTIALLITAIPTDDLYSRMFFQLVARISADLSGIKSTG
jgi:hypothetical protein